MTSRPGTPVVILRGAVHPPTAFPTHRSWKLAPLAGLLLALGCGGGGGSGGPGDAAAADAPGLADSTDSTPDAPDVDARSSFGSGFLFGTSTAGFQNEMGCPTLAHEVCDDPGSDWYAYVTSPEVRALSNTYLNGDDPAVTGPGYWELYADDYDRARDELSNNAIRVGLEWSRIFPTSTVGVEGYEALRAVADPAALETYHAMFEAMHARGLAPFVTLHHYTLPTWVHDGRGCTLDFEGCTERGWLDPERIVPEIAKYAGFVAREFGADVDLWATLNEPFAVVVSGFLMQSEIRSNPPARSLDAESARTALSAMIDAHARMVDAVRAADLVDADGDGAAARCGVVYAMAPVIPADPDDPLDRDAARNTFYLWDLLFLDATAAGMVDAELDGTKVLRDDLVRRMDFIGLNYYVALRVEGLPSPLLPGLSPLLTLNPLTLESDLIRPRGIYEMTSMLQRRYGLPVYVTENNGQQGWFEGDQDTETRIVVETLQWLEQAVVHGVDVRGYFFWTLVDNYEWNAGTSMHAGLYAVDPEDPQKVRTARPLAGVYGRIAEARTIPDDVRLRFPIDPHERATGGVPDEFSAPPL